MTTIPNIPNAKSPVVGEELDLQTLKLEGSQYTLNYDPTSTVTMTKTDAGIKLIAPAAPNVPPVVTTSFDPLSNDLTTTVDGVTSITKVDTYRLDGLQAMYVGPDNQTAVTLGNFAFRISTANNPQIKTVAGTETVDIYNAVSFGAGLGQGFNYNALALNDTTWVNVDDILLTGGDDRAIIHVTPTADADKRFYEITYWHPTVTKVCVAAKQFVPAGAGTGAVNPVEPSNDFFRSAAGTAVPDGTSDYTEAITHNGFIGIGQTTDPISPLEFGDVLRNDVIRLWDGGSTNAHQFFGFGINNSALRYQTSALVDSHEFYGGVNATTSKRYVRFSQRDWAFGDPLAPIGEGHFLLTTGGSDNGALQFKSPNAATGTNKVQGELQWDGYSGNGGITGCAFSIRTASPVAPNNPLIDRLIITSAGDVAISDPTVAYPVSATVSALLTVNGAIRVKSGPILPGASVRQNAGLVFGSGVNGTGTNGVGDSDGGIASTVDGRIDIYCNGGSTFTFSAGGAAGKLGGGNWVATSDIRTKKDITPHQADLESILDLSPIRFRYNGLGETIDNGKEFIGFSAQDLLETSYAHWVTKTNTKLDGSRWTEDDPETDRVLQVDTSELVFELLGAVQMLQGSIKSLENRLAVLEKKPGTRKSANQE